jgi:Bifunctional DNA primase/polymerase, N-terminal
MTPACAAACRAAASLAGQGLRCFPCRAENKQPTTPHGFHDAVAEPTALSALWSRFPGELVGVTMDTTSNLTVLDVDAKHQEARAWWAENRSRMPTTRVHRTRSGGLHVLFRYHPYLRCTTGKLVRGIDTRGEGGYIIWWPAHGCPVLHDAPIAAAPEWLISALHRKREQPADSIRVRIGKAANLDGIIRVVATAPEGTRNCLTFWGACRAGELVRNGKLTQESALALIAEAACVAGLPRAEAIRTALSGLRAIT